MERAWKDRIWRRKKKASGFNPTHQQIDQAINDFIQHGGHIVHVAQGDHNIPPYIAGGYSSAVDDFFLEPCNAKMF